MDGEKSSCRRSLGGDRDRTVAYAQTQNLIDGHTYIEARGWGPKELQALSMASLQFAMWKSETEIRKGKQ